MSISPETPATLENLDAKPNPYSWKIEKETQDPSIVFANLYNLARPENSADMNYKEAGEILAIAHDLGVKKIDSFRGITLGFVPEGNTQDKSAWDLYTYLKANGDNVSISAVKGMFGERLKEVPIQTMHWGSKLVGEIRAKEEAEKATAGAAR